MTGLQPPAIPTFIADPSADAVAVMNSLVRDPFTFLLVKPVVRLRRTGALTVAENTHQFVAFDTADEDTYSGWSGGSPTRYTVQAPGWYQVAVTVSISGTGASGMLLAPSLAVNGASHTGVTSGGGWEGGTAYVATGASTQPKIVNSFHEVYCNLSDYMQLDLWYSTESAITAVDTTAGVECSLRAVWSGV